MDTVVVYESMWGNTAAVARAIAAGLGEGAQALTPDLATPERLAKARLVIAGAPVHGMNLPTAGTRATAAAKAHGKSGVYGDISKPSIRGWIETLAPSQQFCAAFDTGIPGPLGRGAAPAIITQLGALGYTPVDKPQTFRVALVTRSGEPGALLLPGQEEKAFAWGEKLALVMGSAPPLEHTAT